VARARNIKPGFFANEDLAECDPLARLLFAGLWCLADREGRLEDRPKRIRAEILPYDMCDADDLLNQLQARGFILRYSHGEGRFIQVLKFDSHQNPHMKEAKSTIPAPGKSVQTTATPAAAPDEHQTSTVQAPDKNQKSPAESGFLIPDSLIPDSKGETAPRKRAATPSAPVTVKPDDVDQQTWGDFLTLRKAKRAPVTQTVVDDARRECAKAGMTLENFLRIWCRRGSQGLEAAWLKPDERGQAQGETAYQRSMRERMQEAVPEIARKAPSAVQQDATDFFRTIEATSRVIDVPALGVSP
jgi:hypothetical protein